MKCLRPGCDRPAKPNGNGRPAEYCSTACKQSVHRLFQRLLKRRGLTTLLDDVRRAVVAWEVCHGMDLSADHVEHLEEFAAIMDAIAAHPLVGSRAELPRPVVPSSQPLPGATPNFRSAGQGAALAAFQNWPEDD
jgi:hypothetical protein